MQNSKDSLKDCFENVNTMYSLLIFKIRFHPSLHAQNSISTKILCAGLLEKRAVWIPFSSRTSAEHSGSVGRALDSRVRLEIEGLLGRVSLPVESLCLVLEQDTLSTA